MNELSELLERMRLIAEMFDEEERPALAKTVRKFISEFNDCRNGMCFGCGHYVNEHNGACDGCRWRV